MNEPLVSVVMPAFNSAKWIADAIRSIQSQTYINWELLVVDDGSTDNTVEKIESLFEDERIRIFSQNNSGPAVARNLGIEEAKGEFLAFLDADDMWFKDKLNLQLEHLLSNPGLGLVHSGYRVFIDDPHSNKSFRAPGWFAEWHESERLLVCDTIGTLTVMTRTELVRQVGGFREGLFGTEDWDLWIRVSKLAEIFKLKTELACYRIHSSGISQSVPEHFQELEKVYNSHAFQPDVHRRIQHGARAVLSLRQGKQEFLAFSLISGFLKALQGGFHWITATYYLNKNQEQ